jgi:ABC-type transporter Mla subunit MlaD
MATRKQTQRTSELDRELAAADAALTKAIDAIEGLLGKVELVLAEALERREQIRAARRDEMRELERVAAEAKKERDRLKYVSDVIRGAALEMGATPDEAKELATGVRSFAIFLADHRHFFGRKEE